MTDPFEALREPIEQIDPDPLFAAHLRSRLVRALALPQGVTVSDVALAAAPEPAPVVAASLVPYLIVADARRALDWYAEGLGAQRQGEPIVMADGRIGHAEVRLGSATFYLADESPESEVAAPEQGAGATVSLTLEVADVDGLTERALAWGARLERAPADYPHGRNSVIRDPYGHRWIVAGPAATTATPPATATVHDGDIAYVSLWVPDGPRAAAFFAGVLDWNLGPTPAGAGRARQVEGLSLAHGILGGHPRSTLFLCFVVDSVAAAAARVRAAGGEASDPSDEPYGRTVDCVDNQGVRFALLEAHPSERGPRGPVIGDRTGDVAYLTMEVEDSAAARAFYREVLGWRFQPGRVEDGWEPEDVVPMVGLRGGQGQNTVVVLYRVDDIHRAVARVRNLGGQATEPEQQPYGLTAECVDDQGTRFGLGQF